MFDSCRAYNCSSRYYRQENRIVTTCGLFSIAVHSTFLAENNDLFFLSGTVAKIAIRIQLRTFSNIFVSVAEITVPIMIFFNNYISYQRIQNCYQLI